ncbi:MAG: TonB-dependent receptor plug domain-containing protein, partial [Verrucomicrobiota bacterium]
MIIRWKEWSFLFVWSGKLFAEAFELPETVVEEERWRERGDEVRVEAEEWEGAGVVSVPDLLENVGVPVVSAFGDGWSGSPSLRGYSGDRGNRVAILLDGLPVNRPDLAVADWGQLPLNGLEEVRVVRGSRTVRYGSLASGGVIELRSGRSREEMEVALEGFGGSDETWGGSFSVKVPGEWVAMEVSGNTFETEGYRENG